MCTNKYSSEINPNSVRFLSAKPTSPLNVLAVKNELRNNNALPNGLPYGNPSFTHVRNPYGLQNNNPPNKIMLTPAIFGGFAAFSVGFGYFGHSLTTGYSKFIFFVNIYAIIATFGVGYYIYDSVHAETRDARYSDIILPIVTIILFYAAVYNLIYSLYPITFKGTIGDTKITQFLSFIARSIGTISIGESFGISVETAGVQSLTSIEALFNFFVITLLIALLA